MDNLVIHAWSISKAGGSYYLPYCHWIYLTELVKMYDRICLLCPVNQCEEAESKGLLKIDGMDNVSVYELPSAKTYADSIPYFRSYVKAYRRLRSAYDVVYVRFPVAYGWLSRIYFRDKKIIIHFVGDPIEVTLNNTNLSRFTRFAKVGFFIPEYFAFIWACRKAKVYTEGPRLLRKIRKLGVKGEAVFSSTLIKKDFYDSESKVIKRGELKLLHVGYLRKWKGVEIVIRAFKEIHEQYPKSVLTIIGTGEFEKDLRDLSASLGLTSQVNFVGHIEDRDRLDEYYRTHDIFCLTSVSEGSPRVIIEAMANGTNVICTRVGSLPYIFDHDRELLFVDFNSERDLIKKIFYLADQNDRAREIRSNAIARARDLDMYNFLHSVFK